MSKLEQLVTNLLDKQSEVLETIRLCKGKVYGDALAEASETLAVMWHQKMATENKGMEKYYDHASQCVLMIGAMKANKPSTDLQEQAKMLLDFTADVTSLVRHMVHHVAESDLGE